MSKISNIEEFYIILFIIYDEKYYVLWYSDLKDSFVLDKDGLYIRYFKSIDSIKVFADENNLSLNNEITEIVCDQNSLFNLYNIECNNILTFWNIASDIANTLNKKFLGDCNDELVVRNYNKLFYGCNLPAIKGENEDFTPKWDNDDKEILLKIVKDGLDLLRTSLNI